MQNATRSGNLILHITEYTILIRKHCGDKIILWGCISSADTGETGQFYKKIKYKAILEENMLQTAKKD